MKKMDEKRMVIESKWAGAWVLAAALSFVDGALIPFVSSLVVVGMATAFLLGNLRVGVLAVAGLVVVMVCIEVVLVNIPGSPPASRTASMICG